MSGNRRRLLKALTIGGSAVTATRLPATWSQPVVDSVVLPAHAQTTTATPLSGSESLDVALGLDDGPRFGDPAGRSLLERFMPPAHAGVILPGPPVVQLFAYAERDTGMGSGWWRVQVLLSIEFFGTLQGFRDERPTLPGMFVEPAYAIEPSPGACRFERLYETLLQVQADGDSAAGNANVTDGCGTYEVPPEIVSVQLLNFSDPDVATVGTVRAVFSEGPPPVNINIFPGGAPLSADCGETACEILD